MCTPNGNEWIQLVCAIPMCKKFRGSGNPPDNKFYLDLRGDATYLPLLATDISFFEHWCCVIRPRLKAPIESLQGSSGGRELASPVGANGIGLMHSSENPTPNRQYREHDYIPRDLDVGQGSSSRCFATASSDTEFHAESPPMAPQGRISTRYSELGYRRFANPKPRIVGRTLRTIARFFIAVLIGVGVTLACQFYGREAELVVRAWAPFLDPWIPVATTESPVAAAVTVSDLAQQLKPMSLDLAIIRRSLEQLAANQGQIAASQQQMAQGVATLQQLEQQIGGTTHLAPRTASPLAGHR